MIIFPDRLSSAHISMRSATTASKPQPRLPIPWKALRCHVGNVLGSLMLMRPSNSSKCIGFSPSWVRHLRDAVAIAIGAELSSQTLGPRFASS